MTGLEKIKFVSHNRTMKNSLSFLSPKLMAFTLVLGLANTSWAEKIKVKKVKGNSAIVETSSVLTEGETYELLVQPISEDVDYKQSMLKSRQNSLTFGASYIYAKSELSSISSLDLQIRYGWSFSTIEFGLIADVSSLDEGAGAKNTFLGGGYIDYNLVSNRDPKQLIYGPFVLLGAGSTQYPSSQTSGSSTKLVSNLGGFLTYFLNNSSTAIRGEVFYNYQQINTTNTQNSIGGFGIRGLLVYYF
jgi:hypothetical protein